MLARFFTADGLEYLRRVVEKKIRLTKLKKFKII